MEVLKLVCPNDVIGAFEKENDVVGIDDNVDDDDVGILSTDTFCLEETLVSSMIVDNLEEKKCTKKKALKISPTT